MHSPNAGENGDGHIAPALAPEMLPLQTAMATGDAILVLRDCVGPKRSLYS
jgi:hypothetical protein